MPLTINAGLNALHLMQVEIVKNIFIIIWLDWKVRKISRYSIIKGVDCGIDEFTTKFS